MFCAELAGSQFNSKLRKSKNKGGRNACASVKMQWRLKLTLLNIHLSQEWQALEVSLEVF